MSISLSTYCHSTEARSSARSLLKAVSSDGEYSNQVKKSKGSFSPSPDNGGGGGPQQEILEPDVNVTGLFLKIFRRSS